MNAFEFHCPTKIICGEGRSISFQSNRRPGRNQTFNRHRCQPGKTRHCRTGICSIKEADVNYSLYDHVPPDSSLNVVNEVAALYKEEKMRWLDCTWRRFCHRHRQGSCRIGIRWRKGFHRTPGLRNTSG